MTTAQETIKRWIKELRSGHYAQTTTYLKKNGRFCCLGVLADIVDPQGWETDDATEVEMWRHSDSLNSSAISNSTFCEITGFSNHRDPKLVTATTFQNCLINLNDRGESFTKIADCIEVEATKQGII
jgi:hypothetical protein